MGGGDLENYQEKIREQYYKLSNSTKKVAKYLLDFPQSFAMLSASEIGKEIGVSETTVIRFCHSLKYSGFSELQKEIRDNLINAKSSLHNFREDKENITGPGLYYQSVKKDQMKLEKMMEHLNEEDIHRAVERLIESEHVLVSGMRSSYAFAHWFSFTLNLMRGDTHVYQAGTDDVINQLLKLNEKSTLVVISFHRYSLETIQFAEQAKKRGVFIIAISDSAFSPIAEYADIHLPIQLQMKSTIDVAPAAISLLNAILAGVSIHDSKRFQKRREDYDSVHVDGFFYPRV